MHPDSQTICWLRLCSYRFQTCVKEAVWLPSIVWPLLLRTADKFLPTVAGFGKTSVVAERTSELLASSATGKCFSAALETVFFFETTPANSARMHL